jgi:transcription antitermination factor NusG
MPTETRLWRHARAEEPRSYPLFPGYLFARIGRDDLWKVVRADGVHQVVGPPTERFDGLTVPESALAWFGAFEALGLFNRIPWAPPSVWPPGKAIRVKAGKLEGALGEIIEERGQKRMLVALSVFGAIKKTEVLLADLEAA